MTALQQTIYRLVLSKAEGAATDAGFRQQLQIGAPEAFDAALTTEEREALLALRPLLALSPQELLELLAALPEPLAWDWQHMAKTRAQAT